MEEIDLEARQAAISRRLDVVAGPMGVDLAGCTTTVDKLDLMARHVAASSDRSHEWLLFTALSGTYPNHLEMARLQRALLLSDPGTALFALLESTIEMASGRAAGFREILLVENEVVVDVDFCARYEHNTGIQRVVRHTVPEWEGDPDRAPRLLAWMVDITGYTTLTEKQRDRVLHWNDRRFAKKDDKAVTDADLERSTLVVPWNCVLVLAEVPGDGVLGRIAALGEYTPNRISAIGYDAIPLVSADTLPNAESERFAHYLTALKHVDVVAGISDSASDEFRGFVDMLPAQGVTGPEIVSVTLATEVSDIARRAVEKISADPREAPIILSVGSHEPRKNQEAALFAAEVLHREGLDFRIVFVGGGSRQATFRFDRKVKALQRAGMRVESHRRLGDEDLWAFYAKARFTVFPSLHEGFGLPVAESLAFGAPVLTSDFGSLDEIARVGGCLQIDPRDDEQIVDGMRRLLTDDALIARLRDEIGLQTTKSWRAYADELWSVAVAPLQAQAADETMVR